MNKNLPVTLLILTTLTLVFNILTLINLLRVSKSLKSTNYINPVINIDLVVPEKDTLNTELEDKTSLKNDRIWSGTASYYSREGCVGCSPTLTMANGEPLDDTKLTVAFNKAPLNSYVEITNISNGQSVTAKVTDTGGFEKLNRIIDLGLATKNAIGCGDLCEVEVKAL